MKSHISILSILMICNYFLFGTFSQDIVMELTPMERSCANWGDYNNDGYQDLLITGTDGGSQYSDAMTKLYQNDSGHNLVDIINHGLPQNSGKFDWGDYDNDGDLDIALSGTSYDNSTETSEEITKIFNYESGSFTSVADLGNFNDGSVSSNVAWGDYDNDGDLDLLITGKRIAGTKSVPITKLFTNNSGNFIESGIQLYGVFDATTSWGDYDKDGDLDIIMSGLDENSDPITKILKNESGQSFTDVNTGLPNVNGTAKWGDYDNDGDLDILLTGQVEVVYRNDGNDTFTNVHVYLDAGMIDIPTSNGSWGDSNNDGCLDIMLNATKIFWTDWTSILVNNNHNDSFYSSYTSYSVQDDSTDIPRYDPTCIITTRSGSNEWCDYDMDGDLDLWTNGLHVYGANYPMDQYLTSKTYKNNLIVPNIPPTPPIGLYSSIIGDDVTLHWNKGTDNKTPQDGLSYNLFIGTKSGGLDIMSPNSNISTGIRKVSERGNIDQNTSWPIKYLSDGIYFYGVQAIDHGYAGSEFSPECIFVKGEHVLPEFYSINLANNAELRLLPEANLSISALSNINIPDNSKLILEEKSTLTLQLTDLIIHQNTILQLGKDAKLIVENGSDLIFEDGAYVELAGGAEIVVKNKGSLTATGTTFAYTDALGKWLGINCEGGSSIDLDNVVIKNAVTGVYGTGTYKFNIDNSAFEGCTNGINLLGMQPGYGYTITNNTFTGTDNGWGVFITGSDGTFSRNTISHFNIGAYFVMSSPVVSKCEISYNKYFGIIASGHDAIPQLINTEDNQPFGAVNCTIQKNAYLSNSSLFPSAQIGINPTGSIYMRYNDIISSPNFYGISIAQEDIRDPNQIITIDAILNYWGTEDVTDDYFFEHPQYIIKYDPTWSLADEYNSSFNSYITEESRILTNAISLETDDKLTPAIKLYEHIIKKYVDTPEYYVAMTRLPYLYEQAGLDNNVLISMYDEALNSDATSHKKFFKGKKVATHIKGRRYDDAIAVAEEMKAEADFEEEVVLAEINIALATLLKEAEGKGNRSVDNSAYLQELLTKLTDSERIDTPADISENVLPVESKLYQNYPNPFNPVTQITFDLAKTSDVKLIVYNISGQKVTELANGVMNAGNHAVDFDGSKLNSGVYYYTLKSNGATITKKLILTK